MIGLRNLPINLPKLNQSLFKIVSEDGVVAAKMAKRKAITKNKVIQIIVKFQAPYIATIRKKTEKDQPNFLFDGIMEKSLS